MHVRRVKRKVVVAAVPEDRVAFPLGLLKDRGVVHTGVHDEAFVDVRLVFFHFLDGALVQAHVLQRGESLHLLLGEIAVRHGMAHDHRLLAHALQDLGDTAGGLAFSASRAHGADCHDRLVRLDHGRRRAEEREISAQGHHARRLLHHVLVGDVGIGEHRLVDLLTLEELLKLTFRHDGYALRIEYAGKIRRIPAVSDIGNLRSREGHNAHGGVISEYAIEVVKIAPCGAHDDDVFPCHDRSPF